MELIPAIDLLDGRCVRLKRGDFDQVQHYSRSAQEWANDYAQAGARWLHVVDLAASRDGEDADTSPLFDLLGQATQRVQTGGGVRNADDVASRLEAGASRVVVGSIAAEAPEKFAGWLDHFGSESLVAALDVQFNHKGIPEVRTHGWKKTSGRTLWELLDFYSETRLTHVLCTDISRDGLLEGTNTDLYSEMCSRFPQLKVQASGGIRGIDDLVSVAGSDVSAAISGKAILDGLYTIVDANRALDQLK